MGEERPVPRGQRVRGTGVSLAEDQPINIRSITENSRVSTRQADPGVDVPREGAVVNGHVLQFTQSGAEGLQRCVRVLPPSY